MSHIRTGRRREREPTRVPMRSVAQGRSSRVPLPLPGYTGIYMIRCHMINHEEMGVMQTVDVYKG